MQINIKGNELKLNKREVSSCKRIISEFIDNVKSSSKNGLRPTYYFTFLIILHVMSQQLLEDLDDESLNLIFNKLGVKQQEKDG